MTSYFALVSTSFLALATVGTPFFGALLIAALRLGGLRGQRVPGLLAVGTMGITAIWAAGLFAAPRPVNVPVEWIPDLGIQASISADSLSVLFATLVIAISILSLLYSLGYMPHELESADQMTGATWYYVYMLVFSGAMLGTVLAGDLIPLYVFWEITGVISFLLIGLHWGSADSRSGALKALFVTSGGGVAVLLGLLILSFLSGSTSLAGVVDPDKFGGLSLGVQIALGLLLVGAATKSAQVPFHGWLPAAMVAPTPVSAFLHSASLVALGVYLLARFHPLFVLSDLWLTATVIAGVASLLLGGIRAVGATGIKECLAYSTISQYGFIFILLGLRTEEALPAALFSFFQHGIVKAGLFFAAGLATYAAGTRNLNETGRLWRNLPVATVCAAVLALALAGVPPLAGFWIKETFLASILATNNLVLIVAGFVGSALTLIYMLVFAFGTFGLRAEEDREEFERPPAILIGVIGLLAALAIVLGIWPGLVGNLLALPATDAIRGGEPHLGLAYHLDLKLLLSLLALGLGAAGFATLGRWWPALSAQAPPDLSLDRAYEALSGSLLTLGRYLLRLQNGSLQHYLRIAWISLLVLAGGAALSADLHMSFPTRPGELLELRPTDWALALILALVAGGSVLTFVLRHHLHMIFALGAVGYLIAAVFGLRFAPDVSLVQVHVETMVTVLFSLALIILPKPLRDQLTLPARQRLSPGIILVAAVSGLSAAWLSWLAFDYQVADPIADWFIAHAAEQTSAEDIVAAVLVHYRAADTLGEITVFAIAAIGVLSIVRLIRRQPA